MESFQSSTISYPNNKYKKSKTEYIIEFSNFFFLSRIKNIRTFSARGERNSAGRVSYTVRERNSGQASKLEKDSKQKSFIYSTNLKN